MIERLNLKTKVMAKTASTPVTTKEEVTPSNETQETPEVTPTPEAPKEADKEEAPNGVALPEEEVVDNSASAQGNQKEMADDKDAKKVIKEYQKVVDAVAEGGVSLSAQQASLLQRPLVADPLTGQPKFETNDQYLAWLSASGKIVTPAE